MDATKEPSVLSVVIGIKDWEPERLELALRSHMESSIASQVEIVVSDYGSSDPNPIREICEKHGCLYQYTAADIWSRSRALNVGLSLANSQYLLTTDADIIFAPRTLEAAVDFLKLNSNSIVLAQCSNLSEHFSLDRKAPLPWPDIYADATLRPRWGMGGLCAFSQNTLTTVRGFEERMVVWGSEDNDFVKRCRQAGRFMHWLRGPEVGIFHVWHPPYLDVKPKSNNIHEANKHIFETEFTTARNYLGTSHYSPRKPLVSVNIASYNRGDLIGDVIQSVLNQTVQDFELLIYDDGSVDNTTEVVNSFADKRIRFIQNSVNSGVATARNTLVHESIGQYICVHDDDDIMLPNRLELQLNAMTAEVVGNYGGWVDYDSVTGKLSRQPGKEPFALPTVAFTGSALAHGTLMVQTDVMKRFGYHTSFRGGSDYNLIFRLAAAGYKLKHCSDYVILRRIHEVSLTGQSNDKQKLSSRITVAPFLNSISNQVEKLLRAAAKDVKPVEIDPHFNDCALSEFLPDDLFDHLLDISHRDDAANSATVSLYRSREKPKFFARLQGNESDQKLLSESSDKSCFRVPKTAIEHEQDTQTTTHDDKYITSIVENVRHHLCDESCAGHVSFQIDGKTRNNIQNALGIHQHLCQSVLLIEHKNKTYMAVEAISNEMASVVAYSIRSMVELPDIDTMTNTNESALHEKASTSSEGLH